MKKVVSLVLSLAFLMSCLCLSGCSKQDSAPQVTAEDVKNALIDAGFSEANIAGSISINISNTSGESIMILDGFVHFENCTPETNLSKILDAVMPLYDERFFDGCGEFVMFQLKNKRLEYYKEGGAVNYHEHRYLEFLDDTGSYTTHIMVSLNYNG